MVRFETNETNDASVFNSESIGRSDGVHLPLAFAQLMKDIDMALELEDEVMMEGRGDDGDIVIVVGCAIAIFFPQN